MRFVPHDPTPGHKLSLRSGLLGLAAGLLLVQQLGLLGGSFPQIRGGSTPPQFLH